MNKVETSIYTFNNETKKYHYDTKITASNKMAIVGGTADLILDNNNMSGYAVKDLMFNIVLLKVLTDIDFSDDMTLDDYEEFIEETDVIEVLQSALGYNVLQELESCVMVNLQYMVGDKGVKIDVLSSSLSRLINTISDNVASFNVKDTKKFMSAINKISGEINTEKFVKALADSQ